VALAVFWLQTALKNEKSGAARADSTRPSWADCGVFSLTGLMSKSFVSNRLQKTELPTQHPHAQWHFQVHACLLLACLLWVL
jgi:hypothetical protein